MSEDKPIPEVGSEGRSLKNWSVLASIRKRVTDKPEDLARFREDPVKALHDAGFDFDEPLSGPGIHGLTLRQILAKTPDLASMLPNMVTAGQDSADAMTAELKPMAVSASEAALAIANSNANGNANANG